MPEEGSLGGLERSFTGTKLMSFALKLINALHEFRHLGIAFVSHQENLDTSSPLGEAMFTIIGAMAQLERDITRERVKAGVARARARGKQLGRPRKVFHRDHVEQLRAQGLSFRQIGKQLGISPALALKLCRNEHTGLHEAPVGISKTCYGKEESNHE